MLNPDQLYCDLLSIATRSTERYFFAGSKLSLFFLGIERIRAHTAPFSDRLASPYNSYSLHFEWRIILPKDS